MKKLLFLFVFSLFSISIFSTTIVRVGTQGLPFRPEINFLNIILVEVENGVTPSDYIPAIFNRTKSGFIGGIPASSMYFDGGYLLPAKNAYINVNHYEYNGVDYWDRGNFIKIPKFGSAYPRFIDVIFSLNNGKLSYKISYVYE